MNDCFGQPLITNDLLREQFNTPKALYEEMRANATTTLLIRLYLYNRLHDREMERQVA